MANETHPAERDPLSLEALPSDASPPVREPLSPAPWDEPVLAPLPSEAAAPPMSPVLGAADSGAAPIPAGLAPGMPVPPPLFLGGGLAPYPPHYGVPVLAAIPPPNVGPTSPPLDTIYRGTVTIGNIKSDGNPSRGFIKVDPPSLFEPDHKYNVVFVSAADAPGGYLSTGDRCEFRIVDAVNRMTGTRQWKATDVVCIQRATMREAELKMREQALIDREAALAKREADVRRVVSNKDGQARFWQRRARDIPPATREPGVSEAMRRLSLLKGEQEPSGDSRQSVSRDTVEAEVRALVASTDRGELPVSYLSTLYRRKYGRMLDYKSLGFASIKWFVTEIPGLELVDGAGGGILRLVAAAAEPGHEDSKTEPVPAGYEVVAAVLQHLDETRLLPTFLAQQIDDAALPHLEPTDLVELGVAPMTCLAILGASAAGGKAKKLETQDVLHDVATHQSVLEAELREHRREIARLRISREEVSEDLCCSITCELMKDPVVAGDGHTYERVAVTQWFASGARTSPTTNERLDNLTLVPNHTVRRLIAAELERRRDASGADETKGPS